MLRVPVQFLDTFYFLPWRLAIYCPVVLLAASVAYEPGTWALSELLREVSNGFIGASIISCETLLTKSRLDISLRMLRHWLGIVREIRSDGAHDLLRSEFRALRDDQVAICFRQIEPQQRDHFEGAVVDFDL